MYYTQLQQQTPLFLTSSRKGCGFSAAQADLLVNNRTCQAHQVLKVSIDETLKSDKSGRLAKDRRRMMRTQEFKKDRQVFKIAPAKPTEEAKASGELFSGNRDLPVSRVSLSPDGSRPAWKTIGQPTPAGARPRSRSPRSPSQRVTQQARLRELRPYLSQSRHRILTVKSAVATVQLTAGSSLDEPPKKPARRARRAPKKGQVKDQGQQTCSGRSLPAAKHSSKAIDRQSFSVAPHSPIDCGPVNEIEQLLAGQASYQKLHQLTSEVQLLDMDPKVLAGEMLADASADNGGPAMDGIVADGLVVEGADEHQTLRPLSDNTESNDGQVQRKKSKVIFSVKKQFHNDDS